MGKNSGVEWTGCSCRLKDKTVAKNRKPIRTSEELMQIFADLFDEIPAPDTPEEVDAILHEFGYDPDKLAERIRAAAERAMAASPLSRQGGGGQGKAKGEKGVRRRWLYS